jgi:hypothetical protein
LWTLFRTFDSLVVNIIGLLIHKKKKRNDLKRSFYIQNR